jgi:hypothetical protein
MDKIFFPIKIETNFFRSSKLNLLFTEGKSIPPKAEICLKKMICLKWQNGICQRFEWDLPKDLNLAKNFCFA